MAFGNPIIDGEQLVYTGLRSDNYVEGVSGWRIGTDGSTQFDKLQSLSTVTAMDSVSTATLYTNGLVVNGIDYVEQMYMLNPGAVQSGAFPYGLGRVAHVRSTALHNQTYTIASGTPRMIAGVRFLPKPMRQYMVVFNCRIIGIDSAMLWAVETVRKDDVPDSVGGYGIPNDGFGTTGVGFDLITPFQGQSARAVVAFTTTSGIPPTSMFIGVRLALQNASTSSNVTMWAPGDSQPTVLVVEDIGTVNPQANQLPNSGVVWSGGVTPPTPPAPTPIQYTKQYPATWSRTYNADTKATTFDDTPYCYQGRYSSSRGTTMSLIGFPDMYTDLQGATINSATLTYYVAHTYYNAGTEFAFGFHNNASKPGTAVNYTGPYKTQSAGVGGPRTVDITGPIVDSFKAGNGKGIVLGNAGTDLGHYGYINGATQGNKPVITITYTK